MFPKDPNLDVVLEYAAGGKLRATAVEVKFTEPYNSRVHSGIKRAYLENCPWFDELPKLKKLAISMCPDDVVCQRLHPAQLIKHVLGLNGLVPIFDTTSEPVGENMPFFGVTGRTRMAFEV